MSGSRFLWTVALGFLCGVLVRSVLMIGSIEAAFLFLLAVVYVSFTAFDQRRASILLLCALFLTSVSLGIVRMGAARLTAEPALLARLHSYVTLEGVVMTEPDERDANLHLVLDAHTLVMGATSSAVHARVLVQTPLHTAVRYGDTVRASGVVELPHSFETAPDRSFDYPGYLAASGITFELIRARAEAGGVSHANPLIVAAIDLKHAYIEGLRAVLPEPESSLAGGITVGDKRSVGTKLTAEFQRVSLIHILVLSGYNITVVVNALAGMLSFAPSVMRYGVGAMVIGFFVVASGGASSALRSALFAVAGMVGKSRKRRVHGGNALALIAFGMVLWNPFVLVFDPSFQLSMLAAIGIIYVSPIVEPLLMRIPLRWGLREVVSSTLATQATVAPVLLYQSGFVSIYGLPANVLALIAVPAAMFFSALAAVSGMAAGGYAVPLALPAYALLRYILAITDMFATLPFAALRVARFDAIGVCVWFAALAACGVYVHTKKTAASDAAVFAKH